MSELPKEHVANLKNVAILYEHDPTDAQRQMLALRNDQTLFGLYEGVPLSQRQGQDKFLPDKITIFINPILSSSSTLAEVKEEIKHTLWHEIAHYYGLDHKAIYKLEGK